MIHERLDMARETKPLVSFEETLSKLDIRVGGVIAVTLETGTHKPPYRMEVDFGKFGKRVSYGRFTQHPIHEVKNRLVLGVLNFGSRQMRPVTSGVLILGMQYPKTEDGDRNHLFIKEPETAISIYFGQK